MPSPSWPVHCGMVGERNDMVVGQQSPVLNRLPGACSRGYLFGTSTILAAILSPAMPCCVQAHTTISTHVTEIRAVCAAAQARMHAVWLQSACMHSCMASCPHEVVQVRATAVTLCDVPCTCTAIQAQMCSQFERSLDNYRHRSYT